MGGGGDGQGTGAGIHEGYLHIRLYFVVCLGLVVFNSPSPSPLKAEHHIQNVTCHWGSGQCTTCMKEI